MSRRRGLSRVLSIALLAAVLPVGLVSPTSAGAPPVFEDVPPDAFYADAVVWAVAKGVTTGLGGSNQFGPDVVATRSQALTFLWRYVGEPTGFPPSEFEDVPPDSFFADAADWALAVGVTNGIGGSPGNPSPIFGPDLPVDRGQFMTLLHRLTGTPAPGVPAGFVDVPTEAFFEDAANWAAREGITTGFGGTLNFAPAGPLTRAQAVTVLFRYDQIGDDPPEPGTNYSESGPYKVGFHEYKVGLTRVQVFYPVDPADAGTGTLISSVSSADAFSDNFRDTAEAIAPFLIQQLPVELYDEADVSGDGPFPLLLHSHGFSGDPIYVTNHLSHSASWGFIVVAPSHASRNLGAFPAPPVGALSAAQELFDAYTRMVDWNAEEGHPFFGAVDATKVAAEGHSAGGGTISGLRGLGLEVDTIIGQATAFQAPPDAELDQPVLLLPGERDAVIPLPGVLTSFGNQNPVKQLVVIENAGHNPSLDICQPIREQGGLVGPGAGLVAVLPFIAGLLALGEDGCIDSYLLPGLGSGLVRHAVVAQMRWVFGIDGDRDSLEEAFLRQNFRAATGDVQVVVAPPI